MALVFHRREVYGKRERSDQDIGEVALSDPYLALRHEIVADDHDRDIQILQPRSGPDHGFHERLEARGEDDPSAQRKREAEER